MRILFLSEQFPYPLHDGGNLRTFHVLRSLAREHEVCLLAHEPERAGAAGVGALAGLCRVRTVREPAVPRRVVGNLLRRGFQGDPLFVVKNWSAPLLREADELLRREPFDAIHFNMLDTACFSLARRWPQLKIFDSHNCLYAMAGQLGRRSTNRGRSLLLSRESKALRRCERSVVEKMDLTLVCSEGDADLFQAVAPHSTCAVIPNGVDTDYFRPGPPETEAGTLVFTGSMGYYPNAEAAVYFVESVLPQLQDNLVAPRVYLVGKRPPSSVQALHDGERVFVTGEVDDVRPFVHRADVFVVPLQTGGGTRLKILEAFAMGKAVVSTSKGAEGIPAVDGEQILIADDAAAFARQIRRLMSSPALRERLGHSALQLVRTRYDWDQIGRELLDAYGTASEANLTLRVIA